MRTSHLALRAGLAAALAAAAPTARADVVIDWNNHLLDTIRATGGPPCPISRAMAMTHAAIYDAVNSINPTHEPYLALHSAPPGASQQAAAAAAAHRVLVHLFPQRQHIYDEALADSLADVPNGKAENDGIAVGIAAADAIIAARANDGTQSEPEYVFRFGPGDYRPTPPMPDVAPYNPGWGNTVPWTMIDGQQFRPRGPLNQRVMRTLIRSAGYAEQVNQVKSLGARDSTTRTPEQTAIAWFWANDRDGTYKPPGHLNHIAQVVSQDRGLSLQENARLFCLINIAMADAGLVAWDSKYNTHIDLWRPVTAIRLAHTDGNPLTEADPDWLPLADATPPFPAWISGHATFAAALAAVMAGYFGTDLVTFTITTDEPFYTGGPRTYHSFSEAARENALSRIYLGVHYPFDADDGLHCGTQLGNYVVSHMLRPLDQVVRCPADLNADNRLDGRDVTIFVEGYFNGDLVADANNDGLVTPADASVYIRLYIQGCG